MSVVELLCPSEHILDLGRKFLNYSSRGCILGFSDYHVVMLRLTGRESKRLGQWADTGESILEQSIERVGLLHLFGVIPLQINRLNIRSGPLDLCLLSSFGRVLILGKSLFHQSLE